MPLPHLSCAAAIAMRQAALVLSSLLRPLFVLLGTVMFLLSIPGVLLRLATSTNPKRRTFPALFALCQASSLSVTAH